MAQAVSHQYRRGKVTIRQGAETLGVTYMEMNDLLRENNVPLVSDVRAPFRAGRRRPAK